MVTELDKRQCTGCAVCVNVCPVGCISMQQDSEGFFYPSVDLEKCIRCGKCDRLCHMQHIQASTQQPPPLSYLAFHLDETIRKTSSSGGIFSALASAIIDQNGAVYGVVLNEKMRAEHARLTTADEIVRLRGSKYVQSYIGQDIYDWVKKDLENRIPVLYSGTPCQIGALKTFLGKEYENLFTVSFICHGVPSPRVWDRYVAWQQNKRKTNIESVSFRGKSSGWSQFSMELVFADQKEYRKKLDADPYLQVFLKNLCLRPSCHSCQYKGLAALSEIDVILADAWGMSMDGINDDKGLSTVQLNTPKGQTLFDSVCHDLKFVLANYEEIIHKNTAYSHAAVASPKRERFFADFDLLPFDKLYRKYAKTPFIKKVKAKCFRIAYNIAKYTGTLNLAKKLLKR